MRASFLVVLLLAAGCPRRVEGPAEASLVSDVPGLSGLTVDEEGTLWAIPEESRFLLRIDAASGAVDPVPLEGVPEGLETEAIAYLGEGSFALGTELPGPPRPHDDLLMVRVEGASARVEESVRCPYGLWGLEGLHNRGVEGLCAVDGALVVAAEIVGEIGERRFAPLARRGASGQWTSYRVWLTSAEGKISGLSCRAAEGGAIEVLAIERHFGTLRLLRVELPPTVLDTDLEPTTVLNLDAWIEVNDSPNLEGITRLPDGRVALIADNQYGGDSTSDNALYWYRFP